VEPPLAARRIRVRESIESAVHRPGIGQLQQQQQQQQRAAAARPHTSPTDRTATIHLHLAVVDVVVQVGVPAPVRSLVAAALRTGANLMRAAAPASVEPHI